MAYVGFDLDETLGRFSVANTHAFFLQPHIALYGGIWSGLYGSHKENEPFPLPADLKARLDSAFTAFVECIADKERQVPPLGLIRPSMIPLVKQLYTLKQAGAVKAVVLYSNNGNMTLLHLAGKVLELLADAPGLFCNYINWYHPSRRNEVVPGSPGHATKSLAVLKQAFQACVPGEIYDEDIYFFDDIDPPHPGLSTKLGSRYIQVKPYKYDAPFAPIHECLIKALRTSGLLSDGRYSRYIEPFLESHGLMAAIGDRFLEIIRTILVTDQASYPRKLVKPDNSILGESMLRLFPSKRDFFRSLGLLRRLEKKQNRGTVLSPEEKDTLDQAELIMTLYEIHHPNSSNNKGTANWMNGRNTMDGTNVSGGTRHSSRGRRAKRITKKSRRRQ